jgi:hypothetical protein
MRSRRCWSGTLCCFHFYFCACLSCSIIPYTYSSLMLLQWLHLFITIAAVTYSLADAWCIIPLNSLTPKLHTQTTQTTLQLSYIDLPRTTTPSLHHSPTTAATVQSSNMKSHIMHEHICLCFCVSLEQSTPTVRTTLASMTKNVEVWVSLGMEGLGRCRNIAHTSIVYSGGRDNTIKGIVPDC